MILLNAAESRELDRISQEKYGIPSYSLMTRAGEAVADALVERFPDATTDVLVVAGKGNNGGDGFVAGRRLIQDGFAVRAVLLGRATESERRRSARACGVPRKRRQGDRGIRRIQPRSRAQQTAQRSHRCDFRHRTQRGGERRPRRAIEIVNSFAVPTVAVDIASGVNSDTGAIMGVAIRASLTVTFGFAKFGHVSYPGAGQTGELRIVDIGFAPHAIEEIAPRGRFLERADLQHLHSSAAGEFAQGNVWTSTRYRRQPRQVRRRAARVARRAEDGRRPGDGGRCRNRFSRSSLQGRPS